MSEAQMLVRRRRRRTRRRKPKRRYLLKLFILLFLAVLASPFVLMMMVSQDFALVDSTEPPSAEASAGARKLVSQLHADIVNAKSSGSVRITDAEANSIMGLAQRANWRLSGRVNIGRLGALVAVSVHVPENPFGKYFNVRTVVLPSETGLRVESLELGDLSIPGEYVVAGARYVLNEASGNDFGTHLLDSLHGVETYNGAARVHYGPVHELAKQARSLKRKAEALRDELGLLGDRETFRAYYAALCATAARGEGTLGPYLAAAFEVAAERTAAGKDPVAENRVAVLATSVLMGHSAVEVFTGEMRAPGNEQCDDMAARVRVAERRDLRRHFILSAAFHVLSDAGVSFALGEFKELTDAGKDGGSGFSFTDLAADRAGIRFAELALDKRKGARLLQQQAGGLAKEDFYFPSIGGLVDGLTARDFEQQFGSVESPAYLAVVSVIDTRISSLPLYRAAEAD